MLVLPRRRGQSIIIDGRIKVTILRFRGDEVRVGIDAPRDVTVHREEIQECVDLGIETRKGA